MQTLHALEGFMLAVLGLWLVAAPAGAGVKNVILMIGDGMGFEQVASTAAFVGEPLAFESAPFRGEMTTHSLSGVTDSAASATAMATGQKAINTQISFVPPFTDLETSLEIHQSEGRAAGLVTTSFMTDATPAAFAAHAIWRFATDEIASDYLTQTRPEVLMGGGGENWFPIDIAAAGYTVVEDRDALAAVDPASVGMLAAVFGDGPLGYEYDRLALGDDSFDSQPFLSEMTEVALAVLENDPNGFFLMIEQEQTDSAGHLDNTDPNKTGRMIYAAREFSNAVATVLNWMGERDDTLLIVTADHETGGLELLQDNGAGMLPTVSWSHGDHTGVTVPVYAWGSSGEQVVGVIDNTDIFAIALPEPEDNCTEVPNADQRDTDLDGYGNACDADLNNDGVVDFLDLGLLKAVFFTDDADADLNGDGSVDFLDLGLMKSGFFQPPGPSGLACAGTIPCP